MAKRKTPPEILKEFRRKRQNGLLAVAVELTGRATRLATKHHDVGTRRNSITQTKLNDGSGGVLWGIPVKAAPHAPHLELGFRPHWVPAKYIGPWMQRKGAGILRHGQAVRGKVVHGGPRRSVSLRARGTSVSMGMYVGGPGSSLQSAPGGTGGFFGRRGKGVARKHWRTKGGTSPHLKNATVGHPILQPTAEQITQIPLTTYQRGFERGR